MYDPLETPGLRSRVDEARIDLERTMHEIDSGNSVAAFALIDDIAADMETLNDDVTEYEKHGFLEPK